MSEAAAPAANAGAPPKKSNKLLLGVVCLVFTGAGAAFPMVVNLSGKPKGDAEAAKSKDPKEKAKTAIVPFGEVTVNLSEERLQRYLRVKLAVLVDAEAEKEVTDLIAKKKAAIKSAMIAHLAGKTTKDVSGTPGVARMQRELLERLDEVMYPDGSSKAKSVLFEEYVVQ
jgi:flagellar protein FliL